MIVTVVVMGDDGVDGGDGDDGVDEDDGVGVSLLKSIFLFYWSSSVFFSFLSTI